MHPVKQTPVLRTTSEQRVRTNNSYLSVFIKYTSEQIEGATEMVVLLSRTRVKDFWTSKPCDLYRLTILISTVMPASSTDYIKAGLSPNLRLL